MDRGMRNDYFSLKGWRELTETIPFARVSTPNSAEFEN